MAKPEMPGERRGLQELGPAATSGFSGSMCPSANWSRRIASDLPLRPSCCSGCSLETPQPLGPARPWDLSVTGKSRVGRYVWNYCLTCLLFLFFFFFNYNHTEWPVLENPAPLPVKSALVENPVHLPPDGREEEISIHPALRLAIHRRYLQHSWTLAFASSPPPSLICGRSWHPDPSEGAVVRH